jgi:NADH dehydrogenase/NADH:ubiquinone oxidoreductase subunit G
LQSLTVDKANQTITFASLDSKTYGDADFELSATSSSGLVVSYASSDETVAAVEGSTVRIVGAGATTITAAQAGDDNYQAATDVLQTLTVDKANQTITFASLDSKTYGDADFELLATSSSGLAVSYASSDQTVATIEGSTVRIVGVGATTVTAAQAGR